MTQYTMAQLKNLWIEAGGSPTAATMAAAVAMAESGGDPNASNTNNNGSTDRGLWQINSVHGSQSTFDPLANAKAAVGISQNGTTWRPWCTAWSDGLCGGTYLGTGAPVFKFLSGSGGVPVDTVGVPTATPAGVSDMLNPQAWASAFLKPLGTWFFYGAMGFVGALFMAMGLGALILTGLFKTDVGRTVLGLGTSAATRGAINPGTGKGQTKRAASQAVDKTNQARNERDRKTREERERRERERRDNYTPRHSDEKQGRHRRDE